MKRIPGLPLACRLTQGRCRPRLHPGTWHRGFHAATASADEAFIFIPTVSGIRTLLGRIARTGYDALRAPQNVTGTGATGRLAGAGRTQKSSHRCVAAEEGRGAPGAVLLGTPDAPAVRSVRSLQDVAFSRSQQPKCSHSGLHVAAPQDSWNAGNVEPITFLVTA